ncbi:MAG: apolipoprotein N-acyltransferase [Alphaproteobacteria bacterium]|nr:apolipoprotein N-acyltransferase [Alphaproteobacteria bacterium]
MSAVPRTVWLLLAGVAHALSLAWPGNGQALGPVQCLSLAVLANLYVQARGPKQAAWMGWLFGTAHGVAATWWLYISMHQYGGLAAPLAVLAVLALQSALAVYLALALACGAWLRGASAGSIGHILSFSGAWLLAELARAQWFTGFPWGSAGYAHVDSALALLAPFVGVYGMGAVAAALACAVALLWRVRRPLMRGGAMVMSLALLLAMTQPWRAADSTHEVLQVPLTLLQGHVPQDQKYELQRHSAPQWYLDQLAQAGPGLTLAPEIAFPLPSNLWPVEWWRAVRPTHADRAFMVGAPWRLQAEGEYSNSVLAWAGDAPASMRSAVTPDHRYDKYHLVPFGEFIPWGFAWFVRAMHIPLGEFTRGQLPQLAWSWGGLRWAPNICYEDLFGEELAQAFDTEQSPHVMVNFSNIAWFGDTVAQHQHLNISRLRTLELQRPMVRVTNTGSTAIIDHMGHIQARLPHWQRAVMQAQVSGRAGPPTLYARWARAWGLWPLWLAGVLLLALAFRPAKR